MRTTNKFKQKPTKVSAAVRAFVQAAPMLLLAVGASAQQADPTLNTVVVSGVRAALESALNAKRNDNGIVDVIKAEDMGKFPDTNLAESLQRVPGVVIDRDGGEGRSITVRGLGQDFTRVRINGIEALATTGGTDSSGGANRSRGFDFNVFASELFNTVTVRKSSSADVEEGSLGATVDLQTSRPFDLKGFNAMISAKENYNDLSQKTTPRAAFLISNTNDDRTFGVLVSGAFSKRSLYEEGFSTVRWDNGPSVGGWCAPMGVTANPSTSTTTTCGPAAQGVARIAGTPEAIAAYNAASDAANFAPRLPRYGRLTHEQDRVGLTGSMQFKPAADSLLTFDMLYSKLKATRQEDFLEGFSFARTASQGGKTQTSVLSSIYGPNGALLYGLYNGVDIRSESRYDELSTTFTQPTLTWDQRLSDTVKMVAMVGSARSVFDNPIQTTVTLDAPNVNGYSIDFRGNDRLPLITYPSNINNLLGIVGVPVATSGTQPSLGTNISNSEIRLRPQSAINQNDMGKLDLIWDAAEGMSVKGGLNYKKYTYSSTDTRRGNQNETIFGVPAGTDPSSLVTTITNFGKGLNLPAGTLTSWNIPNIAAIAQAYNIYCNCLQSGPLGGPGDFTMSSTTNGNARGKNADVQETDQSAYLMADFETTLGDLPLRGNIGVRYVTTNMVTNGYTSVGGGTLVSISNNYTDILPALNLAANVSKDVVVRVAAASVMARPQLSNLNPGGSMTTSGNLSISTGNPTLAPFRAKTLDTSLEWYYDRNAFVGLGLFGKDISTYIQTLKTTVPYSTTGLPMSLLPANFTGSEVFEVSTPINTAGGILKGLELNIQQPLTFLPGVGKNFGVLYNYTAVSSQIAYALNTTGTQTIVDNLLNLSPMSQNVTLYYDDGTLSGRLSASYRSDYLTKVPGSNNNDVEGKNATTNLDLSVSYKFDKHLEGTLEATNLLNTPNDQFVSRARNSSVVYNVTGRELMVGLRYKF